MQILLKTQENLGICPAPGIQEPRWTRASMQEPLHATALNQDKLDRQGLRGSSSRESDRQTAMVDGVWSWDGDGLMGRGWIMIGFIEEKLLSNSMEPLEIWTSTDTKILHGYVK